MIHVAEDGQLYVDYDALEAVTSPKFVDDVKFVFSSCFRSVKSVRFFDFERYFVLYVLDDLGFFHIYSYDRESSSHSVSSISHSDFMTLLDMFKEVYGE
ncbi:MAG TPA: hypothetical protein VEY70_08770 [Metabacillus sp.]|nr:hypothetical protein [Metabacillus sp.]